MITEKQKLTGTLSGKRTIGSGSVAPRGPEGFSPVVTTVETEAGYEVTITDIQGTKTMEIRHGEKGDNGFSPVVNVSTMDGGHEVTIEDKNGTQSFQVFNGAGVIVCTKYGKKITANDAGESALQGLKIFGKTLKSELELEGTNVGTLTNVGSFNNLLSVSVNGETALPMAIKNGMPGIPMQDVCQKHNYTDENGQKWFTDEIDFARGVYIQRCFTVSFDGTEAWYLLNNTGLICLASNTYEPLAAFDTGTSAQDGGNCAYHICSHFQSMPRNSARPLGSVTSYGSTNGNTLQFNDATYNGNLEGWKAWLAAQAAAGTPVTMVLGRRNPVETALPAQVLEQYRGIKTQYGNTTISNIGGAEMAVTYVADTKLYIDSKFNELAAAIVNNT